jgi:mannose-6-phosphate isomerase-like protein (cupin superfamily)
VTTVTLSATADASIKYHPDERLWFVESGEVIIAVMARSEPEAWLSGREAVCKLAQAHWVDI